MTPSFKSNTVMHVQLVADDHRIRARERRLDSSLEPYYHLAKGLTRKECGKCRWPRINTVKHRLVRRK